jgi:hypothetical protein
VHDVVYSEPHPVNKINYLTELIILRLKIHSVGIEITLSHANLAPRPQPEHPESHLISISEASHYSNMITQSCKMSFFMKSN